MQELALSSSPINIPKTKFSDKIRSIDNKIASVENEMHSYFRDNQSIVRGNIIADAVYSNDLHAIDLSADG